MAQNQMKNVMQGAFVLTVASFVAKLLSAVYRVPFQNLVGDEGFYVYQQVYPIYGLAMTLALSGLPQFISKYIAEKNTPKEQQIGIAKLYPIVFWTSIILWAATFFGSRLIAVVMGNEQLQSLIQVVSFTFLLVTPLSFYRGNFQGNLQMVPTAVSQVVEQFLRVGVILVAAWAFSSLGISIYQTGTIAMAGALIGGGVAWLVLSYYERKINGRNLGLLQTRIKPSRDKRLIRRFVIEGGLISIFTGLLIFYQLIDSFVVANVLELSGMAESTARVAKGVYDRGQPLVQLGLVAATALSSTFLPALTKYLTAKNQALFIKSAKIYLRLTTSIALAAAVGLAILLPYVNYALFKDYAGSVTLMIFVLAIFLMAVIQAYQSIAQSQNRFRPALRAAVIGLAVKLAATCVLTWLWRTEGASVATLLGLLVTLFCLVENESPAINNFWRERNFGLKLLGCIVLMILGIVIYYAVIIIIFWDVDRRVAALLISIFGVAVGASCFVASAIRLKLFTIREWLLLPFGKKILNIRKR